MSNSKLFAYGLLLASCVPSLGTTGSALTGAVFTTDAGGHRVDQNIYDAKEDVYLDGGPGDQAPPGAAALPEGDYYFQVTDPSGHTLLSSDDISCREIHVSADGVIDAVVGPCAHLTGTDQDHADLGAITVQLMPYDDTPNPGGEYKVWVTAVGDYDAGHGDFGFLARDSKTDNFKIRAVVTPPPPVCGNGIVERGEQCDDGNTVDGDGCSSTCTIEVPPPPPPVCGDGIVEPPEECDDGNTVDGDGCSSTCTIQTGPTIP